MTMPDMKAEWRQWSKDPTDARVREFLRASLTSAYAGKFDDPDKFLAGFVTGRRVLDIGVVEHDVGHMQSPNWKHAKIAKWSASCLGIDILEDEIELLRERGFNVGTADATSGIDLGHRYERIVIGDVIEHVDDPVRLLDFARRHLAPAGTILVTTPNPYWVLYFGESITSGTFLANADHVRWVVPTMALELGRRAALCLSSYWLYQPAGESSAFKRAFNYVRKKVIPNSELFTHSFYYVFSQRATDNLGA